MKNQKGMMYIELLASILLVGIVMASSSNIQADFSSPVRAQQVQEVKAFLTKSRNAALAANRVVYVSSTNGGLAACWTSVCTVGSTNTAPVLDSMGRELTHTMSSGVPLIGPSSVQFLANGTLNTAVTFSIQNINITLSKSTGVVI